MDNLSLKKEIYNKLEQLDDRGLYEVNEMMTTYLNNSKTNERWDELTIVQKNGILQAMESIENGKGIKHEVVTEKYRLKYAK